MNDDLTSIRDLAHEVASGLDGLCYQSRSLAGLVAGESSSDRTLNIIQARVATIVNAIDRAHSTARMLSDGLDVHSDSDLGRAHNLRNFLDIAFANAHGLPRDLDRFASSLKAEIETVNKLARIILNNYVKARDHDQAIMYVNQAVLRRPNHMAQSLVRHAVRVVPVGHRCRYDEEFRADLTELAREKGLLGSGGLRVPRPGAWARVAPVASWCGA